MTELLKIAKLQNRRQTCFSMTDSEVPVTGHARRPRQARQAPVVKQCSWRREMTGPCCRKLRCYRMFDEHEVWVFRDWFYQLSPVERRHALLERTSLVNSRAVHCIEICPTSLDEHSASLNGDSMKICQTYFRWLFKVGTHIRQQLEFGGRTTYKRESQLVRSQPAVRLRAKRVIVVV